MIKINDEMAIKKKVAVQKRKDGMVAIFIPKIFFENGLILGDEIELGMDKASKFMFFPYGQDADPEETESIGSGDSA
ncbi:hypothetical protein [Methanocella sp. MCL-LM]|uniref:hypothetical protein n=1 Tax=Methanocella sp. MCL-LM TaxID=3412035 RepID=UPI003C71CFFE